MITIIECSYMPKGTFALIPNPWLPVLFGTSSLPSKGQIRQMTKDKKVVLVVSVGLQEPKP